MSNVKKLTSRNFNNNVKTQKDDVGNVFHVVDGFISGGVNG